MRKADEGPPHSLCLSFLLGAMSEFHYVSIAQTRKAYHGALSEEGLNFFFSNSRDGLLWLSHFTKALSPFSSFFFFHSVRLSSHGSQDGCHLQTSHPCSRQEVEGKAKCLLLMKSWSLFKKDAKTIFALVSLARTGLPAPFMQPQGSSGVESTCN